MAQKSIGRSVAFVVVNCIVTSVCISLGFGQSMDAINAHLALSFDRIQHYDELTRSIHSRRVDYLDSLGAASAELERYLVATLPVVPTSLTDSVTCSVVGLGYGINVASSPDGMVREWAWNSCAGGTMPDIVQLLEIRTERGIRVIKLNADSTDRDLQNSWWESIRCVTSEAGRVYYLPLERWVADREDCGEVLSAFTISDTGIVVGYKLFHTQKEALSEIALQYPIEVQTWEDIHRHTIEVSGDGKTITVPLLTKDGEFTTKLIRYRFDGEAFYFKGID